MPDVDAILDRLSRLPEQPPVPPPSMDRVVRRSRQIRRRRGVALTTLGAVALLAVGALALASDSGGPGTGRVEVGPASRSQAEAPTPASFVEEVLATIEESAYFATPEMVDGWRAEAAEVVAAADEPADTYTFVAGVIADLDANDPNRQGQALWAPDRVAAYEARPPAEPQRLPSSQLDDGVGYLDLTPLDAGPQSDEGAQYVRHVRSALSATACGWVLDLRAPYPHADSRADTMLSAVAPLLPEGGAFGYRFRDGARNDFAILPDGSISDTADGTMVAPAVGSFTATGVPVAVLQGTGTTASYESLLVAFSGRDGVRTFGEPSAGQPVLRRSFPLSDGSLLWLTTGVAVGHEGDAYGGPIGVDASISSDVTQSGDPAREAAEEWLSQQPSCS